jgi:hypothetical protein
VELTRQQLDSRDLAAALYMNALTPLVRDKVEERVNMTSAYFDQAKITKSESRAVVAHLHTMATAFETSIVSSSRRVHAPQNQVQVRANQPNNQQRAVTFQSTKHHEVSANRRSDTVHQVPDELFQERKHAGLCGKCGSSSHNAFRCRAERSLAPVPASKSNVRANMIFVPPVAEAQHVGAPVISKND